MESGTTSPTAAQRRLLERARDGDERAFRELIEPHRAELRAHCYRMLGSFHDAEDALQETLIRGWRGLRRFELGRSLRPWLYRISTNACLDLMAKRPARILPIDHGPPAAPGEGPGEPLADAMWLEPYPDHALGAAGSYAGPEARYEQRESVELAFIVAVQHLPPRQRAVLLLRDVLGFSARESAEVLETSVPSVNSALQRARKAAEGGLPARSQQGNLRSLGDERVRDLVRRYVEAWANRDVSAIVALLAEDATFAMPPHPQWFQGRDAVIAFITTTGKPNLRPVSTTANGQPAVGWYLWDSTAESYAPASFEVLTLEGSRVKQITAFVFPQLFPRLGLPAALARED